MASLRASFEKELKNKLSQKATAFQSEENVLLKAFKYFDLQQSGSVDKLQFLKVVEKLGLPVFNPNDFFQLFEYYDLNRNGTLEYKKFIGNMFSNTTATTRQQSPQKSYGKSTSQYYRGHTSQDSVLKFQQKLHKIGSSGILTLATYFQQNDRQQSRQVQESQFVEGARQIGVNCSVDELKEVFEYFDKSHNGLINFDEFLEGLRGPISGFRRDLIRRAFNGIDLQNSQVIAIDAVKGNYNGRAHPDVRVGKKTEKEVISEFIRNMDMFANYLGIQDGQITLQEFENFLGFISSAIDNDTYFELFIKSTFSLGQNQYIQEQNIQHQLKLQQQKQDNIQKQIEKQAYQQQLLQQQQRDYSNSGSQQQYRQPSPQQSLSNRSVISSQSRQAPSQIDSTQNDNNIINQPNFDNQSQNSRVSQQRSQVSEQRSQVSQQRSQISQQQSQRSQVSQQQSQRSTQSEQQRQQQQQQVFELLFEIRKKLASRGARGFLGIQRQFKIMDDDYDSKISLSEFKKAMSDYKINLSEKEYELVFDAMDLDNSGKLDIDEVVRGIRGPMNKQRQDLVTQVFQKLDIDQDGIITVNDIKGIYSARYHPDVRKGTRSEDEVLGEFLETFELHHNLKRGTRDQRVTLEEFIEYYNNVSANIDNEEYFQLMINNAYKINNENQHYEAFSASPGKPQQIKTQQDHRSLVTRNAPFGTEVSKIDYSTTSRPQSAFVQKHSNIQQGDIYKQQPGRLQGDKKEVPAGTPSWEGFQWKPEDKQQNQPQTVQQLIQNLKEKLISRGTRGILSLGKFFRIADKDNTGYLDIQEFQQVINNLRLNQNEEDNFKIFSYFDRDQNGQLSYDEFLRYIRGNMNENRRNLTMTAFQKFDKDGSGQIDINDLKGVYNAQNHPDVRSGKKTEEEVLGEYLDTFELHHALQSGNNSERNQVVTWEEFLEYYENISCSIDDDRYYEALIRSSWNIPAQKQSPQIENNSLFY